MGKGLRVGPFLISFRTAAEIVVGVILAVSLLIRSWQLDRAIERAAGLALVADTLEASRDTSRRLALANTVLDSALRVAVQRQAVQRDPRADSLDRALHLERITTAQLTAQVERLATVLASEGPVVENAEGERSARFVVDSIVPYHVTAEVFMPRPPEAATLRLAVSIDSIALDVRHGCGDPNGSGIRSAFVTVVGPKWAPLQLGRVEQDPGLCRSPALEPVDNRSRWRKILDRAGVSVGVDMHGRPNALAGFRVWP